MPDRADIAAGQNRLLHLERHCLADLAGANQLGFALDDAEQFGHDFHQVLGELAGLGGRRGRGNWRRCLLLLRMLIHVWFPKRRSSWGGWLAAESACDRRRWKFRRRRPWRRISNIVPSASSATRRCPAYRRTGLRP